MTSLSGKKLLVVGGTSGIGLAIAKAALDAGAAVTIASRSSEKGKTALSELGNNATAVQLDATDNAAVERFFADHGEWDHIAVSAAQTGRGPIREMSLDDARAAMDSKFWGTYRIARAARIKPTGSLTLVSGLLGLRPSATAVLQGAINAAIESLGRGLALEFAPVRVNTISPGMIDTPIWSKMAEDQRRTMYKSIAEKLPVKRMGTAEDIGAAALFLMINGFTTGETLRVDGGGAIS